MVTFNEKYIFKDKRLIAQVVLFVNFEVAKLEFFL